MNKINSIDEDDENDDADDDKTDVVPAKDYRGRPVNPVFIEPKGIRPLRQRTKEAEYEILLGANNDGALGQKVGVLGEGGMGLVFTARHLSTNRDVALKIVNPIITGSDAASLKIRLLWEAQALACINHPGVPPLYDIGFVGEHIVGLSEKFHGSPYYTMRKIPDPQENEWKAKLRSFFELGGSKKRPEFHREVRRLIRVAEILESAHKAGIVHRDVKPSNIMILNDEIFLVDWGLAASFGSDKDEMKSAKPASFDIDGSNGDFSTGTSYYAAPEGFIKHDGVKKDVGPAWDVYLLGAILFHLVTGYPPHDDQHPPAGNRIRECPSDMPVEDHEYYALTKSAMKTEPTERIATAQEFRNRLLRSLLLEDVHIHLRRARELTARQQVVAGSEDAMNLAKTYDVASILLAKAQEELPDDEVCLRLHRELDIEYARFALSMGDLVAAKARIPEDRDDDLTECIRRLRGDVESALQNEERTWKARFYLARDAVQGGGSKDIDRTIATLRQISRGRLADDKAVQLLKWNRPLTGRVTRMFFFPEANEGGSGRHWMFRGQDEVVYFKSDTAYSFRLSDGTMLWNASFPFWPDCLPGISPSRRMAVGVDDFSNSGEITFAILNLEDGKATEHTVQLYRAAGCWQNDCDGALGTDNFKYRHRSVYSNSYCGDGHSAAINDTGSTWAMGRCSMVAVANGLPTWHLSIFDKIEDEWIPTNIDLCDKSGMNVIIDSLWFIDEKNLIVSTTSVNAGGPAYHRVTKNGDVWTREGEPFGDKPPGWSIGQVLPAPIKFEERVYYLAPQTPGFPGFSPCGKPLTFMTIRFAHHESH